MTMKTYLKKALSFICATVLVMSLLPVFAAADDPQPDPDTCTLAVSIPAADLEAYPELKDVDLTVKLYKVGELSWQDTYASEDEAKNATYVTPLDKFASVEGLSKITPFSESDIYTVSEALAELISETDEPDYTEVIKETGELTGLAKGIYLVTAAGHSDLYNYTSTPVLVMLPMASIYTNRGYDWNNAGKMVLKICREDRNGSLQIVKTLSGHLAKGEKAGFVFHVYVTWIDEKGETVIVHDNVHTISFEGNGTESIVIEDLPIGSIATVEEVYSGRFVSGGPIKQENIVIPALEPGVASFVNNDYPYFRRGHSVENIYKYNAEVDGYGISEQKYYWWFDDTPIY